MKWVKIVHHDKTKVNGEDAGFGIQHDSLIDARGIISKYNLKVIRLHTHIGSGSDPEAWAEAAKVSFEFLRKNFLKDNP